MGKKTKIDWCDSTWNPVTGCLHGCEYCYARRIARRFDGKLSECQMVPPACAEDYKKPIRTVLLNKHVLEKPLKYLDAETGGLISSYPFGFDPTFFRYRLDVPQKWTKPRTIFVCSMADLFGEWVPDEWIIEVLNACRKAPWHRYLFLTKNPKRYDALEEAGIITDADMNFWLGSTVTEITKDMLHCNSMLHTFMSCEPMLNPWPPASEANQENMRRNFLPEWVIFGVETGNRKNKVIPEKAWLDNAVRMCRFMGAYVFMKESLREIMGNDFIQEFPWEVE